MRKLRFLYIAVSVILAITIALGSVMVVASEDFSRIVKFAVNSQGGVRLLDTGNNTELKKNETLLTVPSVQWVQSLESSISSFAGKVGQLETGVAALEGAASNLNVKVDGLQSKITTLETNDGVLLNRVTGLEGQIGGLKDQDARLIGEVDALKTRVNALENSVTTLQANYSTLSAKVNQNNTTLTQQVATLNGALAALQSQVAALSAGNGSGNNNNNSNNSSNNNSNNNSNPPANVNALWNGNASGVTHDPNINMNAGVNEGATWTKLPSGQWYLNFDGVDDDVKYTANTGLDIASALTMKAWVYRSEEQRGYIFSKNVQDWAMEIGYDTAKVRVLLQNSAHTVILNTTGQMAGSDILTGRWYQISFTYDTNGNWVKYVNGVSDVSGTVAYTPLGTGGNLTFGERSDGILPFKGGIALVDVQRRALTASEILQKFNAEKALFGIN